MFINVLRFKKFRNKKVDSRRTVEEMQIYEIFIDIISYNLSLLFFGGERYKNTLDLGLSSLSTIVIVSTVIGIISLGSSSSWFLYILGVGRLHTIIVFKTLMTKTLR